jgi:signal transduction protein with GAF and PtsI domain
MPLRPPPDAEDKLCGIRSVTDAALSHLGADDLLTTLLDRVREILDADTAAVLLLDSSGRQLIATAASGLEEEVSQGVRVPVGQGFAGRIAAERRPVILDHIDHDSVLNPLLLQMAADRAALAVQSLRSARTMPPRSRCSAAWCPRRCPR